MRAASPLSPPARRSDALPLADVEIVDADTRRPFPGFWVPAETPPPFVGDSTRAKIEWQVEHDLVFDAPVRLKFYLHQARLFSWWLEPKG